MEHIFQLGSSESSLTIRVKGELAKAGINPLDKLIDRLTDDNPVTVEIEKQKSPVHH